MLIWCVRVCISGCVTGCYRGCVNCVCVDIIRAVNTTVTTVFLSLFPPRTCRHMASYSTGVRARRSQEVLMRSDTSASLYHRSREG